MDLRYGIRVVAACLFGVTAVLFDNAAIAETSRHEATRQHLQQATPDAPILNGAFLPQGDHGTAHTPFNGRLVLVASDMRMEPPLENREVMGQDARMFPGIAIEFFTHEGDLVPVVRDVMTPEAETAENSFWQLIVQPGRVWSEPADEGWSRASFPFALMNRLENDTHNGVATFTYNGEGVSSVFFQITQQTAPFYIATHFEAWGALEAEYEAVDPARYAAAREDYAKELADSWPKAPWVEFASAGGMEALSDFDGGIDETFLVMSALVDGETIYYQPAPTPRGPYPYPERMRFGVWSITKSIGPALGMLRLAERYGDWVFALELTDYLDIDPPHDGWRGVTFGDALNMATGLGGGTVNANPNHFYVDYDFAGDYDAWYRARSADDKIAELSKVGNYPWGPGLVARYRDRDMFALGAAMDAFLKSVEGPDADIWRMIAEDVFRPIGIHHAPVNRTIEPDGGDGLPLMAWGWYPNLDDLAKVASLLHDRGSYNGEQILHRDLTEAVFSVEGTLDQGPANAFTHGAPRYKMGFHYAPFRATEDAETAWIPYMSGWIGNRVVLVPNGMTGIRISKAWPAPDEVQAAVADPTSMIEVTNRLRPFTE